MGRPPRAILILAALIAAPLSCADRGDIAVAPPQEPLPQAPLPSEPSPPEPAPRSCEETGDGMLLCEGDVLCFDEGSTFLCQDTGTREREPQLDPGRAGSGVITARAGRCAFQARLGIETVATISRQDVSLGIRWADSDMPAVPTPVSVIVGNNLRSRTMVDILFPSIAPPSGSFAITWREGGALLRAGGANAPNSFGAGGTSRAAIETAVRQTNARWRTNGWEFPATPAPAARRITGTITYNPAPATGVAPCSRSHTFLVSASPNVPQLPRLGRRPPAAGTPMREADEATFTAGGLRRFERDETISVVRPLDFVWGVPRGVRCCVANRPIRIVQFARAWVSSPAAQFRQAKGWSLDIRESEKIRARQGQTFDPGFTNTPGRGGTGTQVRRVNGPLGGRASRGRLSHWDAPGMSFLRYLQLLETPGTHVFYQQFFAAIVCSPRSTRVRAADAGALPVLRAAVFTVRWTFAGPANARRVTVTPRTDDVEDIACASTLAQLMAANGIPPDALARPGPSRLDAPSAAAHRALGPGFATGTTIRRP